MATGPIETHLHRSFNWENGAPGPQEGPRGRSANCGNGLSAQSVRLRSEINLKFIPTAMGIRASDLVESPARFCFLDSALFDISHPFFLITAAINLTGKVFSLYAFVANLSTGASR